MKITSAKIYHVNLPLTEPFIVSYHYHGSIPSVILELHTDVGIIGYGEGTPDEHVTGETIESVMTSLENYLLPSIKGISPFQIEELHQIMDKKLHGNPSAKAAIDIACYDLMGKYIKQPVYSLLGGKYHPSLEVPVVISILEPEEMASKALQAKNDGFSSIKLKVGTNPNDDIARVKAVREAVGNMYSIKVDVNQGWHTADQALKAIKALEELNIEWLEQPTLADDIDTLAWIRSKTFIPIMADESVHGIKELREIIAKQAADKINIKLMKSSGLYKGAQLVHIAEMAGLTCQIGSMVESSIGSLAGLHLATAKKSIHSHELVGPWMLSNDVCDIQFGNHTIELSDKPGLGIEIDQVRLDELTVTSVVVD